MTKETRERYVFQLEHSEGRGAIQRAEVGSVRVAACVAALVISMTGCGEVASPNTFASEADGGLGVSTAPLCINDCASRTSSASRIICQRAYNLCLITNRRRRIELFRYRSQEGQHRSRTVAGDLPSFVQGGLTVTRGGGSPVTLPQTTWTREGSNGWVYEETSLGAGRHWIYFCQDNDAEPNFDPFLSGDRECEGRARDSFGGGFNGMTPRMSLWSTGGAGRHPIYRCVSEEPGRNDHFVSMDYHCEGERREARLGFAEN